MRKSTLIRSASLAALCWLGTISASSETPLRKVVLQLDWIFNAQFSGVYAAIDQGYFTEVGIELEVRPVAKGQATVEAVVEEELPCFGSAESNVLIKARAEGAPVVALASMFQGSPMGWMYLEGDGIDSLPDFVGKKIGIHPDGLRVIEMAFAREGLSISESELEIVGHDVGILLSGEVDVLQGYYIDEYVKLQLLSEQPVAMLLAKDYGYSTYSQVVFCPESLLESEPELAKDFVGALRKGWEYALANQIYATDLLLENYAPNLDRDYQLKSLEMIEALVKPDGQPALSPMDPAVWEEGQRQFLESGILSEAISLKEFLRQDFE